MENTQIGLRIGNAEICNMLVQDQVQKLETTLDKLREQEDALVDRERELLTQIRNLMEQAARKQYENTLTKLTALANVIGFIHWYEEGKQVLTFNTAWCVGLAFEQHKSTWTEEELSQVESTWPVEYSWLDGRTRYHMPISAVGGMEVKVRVPEEVRALVINIRQIRMKRNALFDQIAELQTQLSNIDLVERKVLAALTKNALLKNPELFSEVQNVLQVVETNDMLLLPGE